jgi:hypothetical protein
VSRDRHGPELFYHSPQLVVVEGDLRDELGARGRRCSLARLRIEELFAERRFEVVDEHARAIRRIRGAVAQCRHAPIDDHRRGGEQQQREHDERQRHPPERVQERREPTEIVVLATARAITTSAHGGWTARWRGRRGRCGIGGGRGGR